VGAMPAALLGEADYRNCHYADEARCTIIWSKQKRSAHLKSLAGLVSACVTMHLIVPVVYTSRAAVSSYDHTCIPNASAAGHQWA
jgi:hypothetical protein